MNQAAGGVWFTAVTSYYGRGETFFVSLEETAFQVMTEGAGWKWETG